MHLDDIEIFAKVVEVGSFSKAASILGLPKSTVSRRLASFEERLGVKLINRSTRHVSLTSIGHVYYEKCLSVLSQLEEANTIIKGLSAEPAGRLRISVPYELGLFVLPEIINDFLIAHPRVTLDVELANRMVDLIEEGVDVVLRIGQLADSSLAAVKIGTIQGGVFASPGYFDGRPLPRDPSQLPVEECIQFRTPQTKKWLLTDVDNNRFEISPKGRIVANSMQYISQCAVKGLGIAALNRMTALPFLRTQKLVEILPNYKLVLADLYAVYPSRKLLAPNVRAFLDFIKPRLAQILDS